jgi:eukaryotic-like serine/threonine-protein kinase
MGLESGHRLGRYEIRSLIGSGGMGEVYLAHDTKLERKVALKLLLARYTTSEDRLGRFAQEARAASGLNHPNIVTVHDVDVDDGTHFISTEFVEGETLRSRLRRGRLPLSEALQIATQVADALAAAHREGIVHRDIKPENILLRPDGNVKVVDFGLAKLAEDGAGPAETMAPTRAVIETDAGVVLGTMAYMSPEQARGLPVDSRTDVWSLGVVLYEMIAGRRPFDGPTSSDIIALILQRDPPKLAPFAPEATGEIELVVETALAKDVEERYQSARDLLNALKRVRKHLDTDAEIDRALPPEMRAGSASSDVRMPSATSDGPTPAAHPSRTISSAEVLAGEIKRHKTVVAATLALLVMGLAATGYWAYRRLGHGQAPAPFEHFKTENSSQVPTGNARRRQRN